MLEAIEAWSGFVLVLIFLGFILATLFMWVGIKAAGIENITFKKIFITAITSSLLIYFTTMILTILPIFRTVPSYVIGLLLSFLIIKFILGFTFQQTLTVWGINVVAHILAVFICARLFIGGLKDLIKIT